MINRLRGLGKDWFVVVVPGCVASDIRARVYVSRSSPKVVENRKYRDKDHPKGDATSLL